MASDNTYVVLTYKGDVKTETYSGSVKSPTRSGLFSGLSFEAMYFMVSAMMMDTPEASLLIKNEKTGAETFLPKEIEVLLRTDVKSAVAALTVKPQTIFVRQLEDEPESVNIYIRTGHDTLADAFGEKIYVRARLKDHLLQVEDPLTGRWTIAAAEAVEGGVSLSIHASDLAFKQETPLKSSFWVSISLDSLLESNSDAYYLPRQWNEPGWISHEQLTSKYEQYKKEKANAGI